MSHVSTWEAPPHRKSRIVDRAGLVRTGLPYTEGDAVVPAPRAEATKNVRRFTLLMNPPTKRFREIIGPRLSYPGMDCLCQHSGSIRGHGRNNSGAIWQADPTIPVQPSGQLEGSVLNVDRASMSRNRGS